MPKDPQNIHAVAARNMGQLVLVSPDNIWWYRIGTVILLTTGTMLLMWLGEQITERGIGNGMSLMIYAGIVVLEGLFQYTDENSLRFELQHLNTRQDHGNWATALAEFTFSPHWSLMAMDQSNYGGSVDVEGIHYPLGSAVYTRGANRSR